MTHAKLPAVCVACMDRLLEEIEAADDLRLTWLHCAHSDSPTSLRVKSNQGVALEWRIEAPIELERHERIKQREAQAAADYVTQRVLRQN